MTSALPHTADPAAPTPAAKSTDAGVAASSPRRSSPLFSTPPLPSRTARRLYHDESDLRSARPAAPRADALTAQPPAAAVPPTTSAAQSAATCSATLSLNDHIHRASSFIRTSTPGRSYLSEPLTLKGSDPQRAVPTISQDDGEAPHALNPDQKWSQRECEVLCSSFKHHGRDWNAIQLDVEAVEGNSRSNGAIKAQFHRLRHKGLVKEEKEGASSLQGQAHASAAAVPAATSIDSTTSRPRPRGSRSPTSDKSSEADEAPKRPRRPKSAHQWTDEERTFLWRIGERHHSSKDTDNKERAVFLDWKKRYPGSTLTSHVVSGYYYYLRKMKRESDEVEAGGQERGSTRGSAVTTPRGPRASTATTARASSSTLRGRVQINGAIEEQRVMGKGLTWTAAEIKVLERIHDEGIVNKADWAATQTVFGAFCRLLPGTLRTHNAVRNKWVNLFYSCEDQGKEEEDDKDDGSGGGEEDDVEKGHASAEIWDRTLPSAQTFFGLDWQQQQQQQKQQPSTSTSKISPLWPGNHFATPFSTSTVQQQQPSLTSFPNSSTVKHLSSAPPPPPPPQLNLSISLTSNGITFENLTPAGLGVAVYSPRSFEILGLQQIDALARSLENHAAQVQSQLQPAAPAFLVQVVEQGAVRVLRAPEGSTTSVGVVKGGGDLAVGAGRGGGEGERMGVEYRIVGPDLFTLRLLTCL